MNRSFNIKRFYYLFKKDLVQGYKNFLISAGALFGVFLLLLFVSSLGSVQDDFHEIFLPFLWLGGFIFTSTVFKDAHSSATIHEWLMTPASRLEKFLQKLLLSTVFYVIALLVIYLLASLTNTLLFTLFSRKSIPVFNPFQGWLWANMGHYMIVQSLFFLGALWFRKYNFIKTILAINVVQISFALLLGGTAFLSFYGPIKDSIYGNSIFMEEAGRLVVSLVGRHSVTLIRLAKVLYFALLAPFFWYLSWLRIKEIEVSDGI